MGTSVTASSAKLTVFVQSPFHLACRRQTHFGNTAGSTVDGGAGGFGSGGCTDASGPVLTGSTAGRGDRPAAMTIDNVMTKAAALAPTNNRRRETLFRAAG